MAGVLDELEAVPGAYPTAGGGYPLANPQVLAGVSKFATEL